ncbi:unnamed protein product [Orchesella dallaii]|uniref:Uncharacterized protein n=1 Tax=Orchesella dallaii TaxID=48710 RepID=A0ABP1RXD0_9HEXA
MEVEKKDEDLLSHHQKPEQTQPYSISPASNIEAEAEKLLSRKGEKDDHDDHDDDHDLKGNRTSREKEHVAFHSIAKRVEVKATIKESSKKMHFPVYYARARRRIYIFEWGKQ